MGADGLQSSRGGSNIQDMKKKPSELFEGENSSLRNTFNEAAMKTSSEWIELKSFIHSLLTAQKENMKCPQCGLFFHKMTELNDHIQSLLTTQKEEFKKLIMKHTPRIQKGALADMLDVIKNL